MIWFMFALGQVMHLLSQVDSVARAKNTPVTSRIEIIEDRAIPIVVRIFICSVIFGITLGGGMPALYKVFGSEAPQWIVGLGGLLANTSIVGYMIAALIGFGADSAIGYIPVLKAYIPPPIDQETAVSQKGFSAGVDATKDAVKGAVEDVHPVPPAVPDH